MLSKKVKYFYLKCICTVLILHRAYTMDYANYFEHLYFCAVVSVMLCNYTVQLLVGTGVSMTLCGA